MRALPEHHNDPETNSQQSQRDKLKLISSFFSKCKPLINIGFAAVNPKKTAFNNAIKHNIAEGIEGTFPDYRINVEKLRFSTGKLSNLSDLTINAVDNTLELSWTDNTNNEDAFSGDQLHLCVVDEAANVHLPGTTIARNVCSCQVKLPAEWRGRKVYIFGFMTRAGVVKPRLMREVSGSWGVGDWITDSQTSFFKN